jgi:NAD+ kinase
MNPVTSPSIRSAVVLTHPNNETAFQEAGEIARFLESIGVKAASGQLYDEDLRARVKAGEFEAIIALGGDGTMLRTGHLGGPCGLPILGINQGRFGFLMEVRGDRWREMLPRLISGDYWLEFRMTLCAEHWRGEQKLDSWEVMNEVVVGRGQIVRPVRLTLKVDARYLTTYVADALIAATPTGSTAYAMAAGGPILPPELRNILIVPVAPHLSIEQAIVLAEGSSVSITVSTDHTAVVCVDGQTPVTMEDQDRVEAFAGDHSVKFIRFQDPGYFYRNLTPHMDQNPSIGTIR